jgi:hypothetical protein
VSGVVDPIRSRCYKKLLCAAGSVVSCKILWRKFSDAAKLSTPHLLSCWWKRVRNAGNRSHS